MSFEEMYEMIYQIQQQVTVLNTNIEQHMKQQPDLQTENRIITGPEMRKIMGLSENRFREVQKKMYFVFRYGNNGTIRAWRSDFEDWLKKEYSPKL